jgi:hypothetical protein
MHIAYVNFILYKYAGFNIFLRLPYLFSLFQKNVRFITGLPVLPQVWFDESPDSSQFMPKTAYIHYALLHEVEKGSPAFVR